MPISHPPPGSGHTLLVEERILFPGRFCRPPTSVMKMPFAFLVALALAWFQGKAFCEEAGEEPPPSGKPRFTEEVLRLQVFLDQHLFAPGKLDGLPGEFTVKALQRYQWSHGLPFTDLTGHSLDLAGAVPQLYTTYAIRPEDLPFTGDLPSKPEGQSHRKYLPYQTLLELVAERYHSSEGLLRLLNGTKSPIPANSDSKPVNLDNLKPGDPVLVPNVDPFRIEEMQEIASLPDVPDFQSRVVHIDTRERMLDVFESSCGPLVASFPITPGSGRLATPPGSWRIVGIATMPTFRWDESVLEYGVRSDQFYQLPIGPNNPVGVLWTGLNKPGIGIHGTNNPETIGRAASHGCMRTANWDAARFAKLITKGLPVIIEGDKPEPRLKPARAPEPPVKKPWFWWLGQNQ